jgi:hypothetical protein
MSFQRILTLILALAIPATVSGADFTETELTSTNYLKWRDHVLPRTWELSYRKIAWRPSFWEAVIEAQEKEMPILLWAMNGHPLCNT